MKKLFVLVIKLGICSGCAISSAKWVDGQDLCAAFGGVKSIPVAHKFVECKHGVYVQRVK